MQKFDETTHSNTTFVNKYILLLILSDAVFNILYKNILRNDVVKVNHVYTEYRASYRIMGL